jgi:hypothetical protein
MPTEAMTKQDPKVSAEIAKLNKQFYVSFDTQYFLQKCFYLLALLGNPKSTTDILKQGVSFKRLRVKIDDEQDAKLLSDKLEQNLKAEIATTYFHAIETLFRIMFAHVRAKDCPWVELTINNNFSEFKADVESFTKQEYFTVDHKTGLSLIFYSRTDKPKTVPKKVWDKSLDNLSVFLDYFGRDLLKSYAYNSYKHGLAMFSDEFGFSLGEIMKVDKDDALVFLSYVSDKDHAGYKQLQRNYTFTRWEQKWAFVHILTPMLEQIVGIGNWRYSNGEYEMKLFDQLDLLKIIKNNDSPFQPDTVSESSFSFKLDPAKKRGKKHKKNA